jgi:hypothetical protein
VVLTVARVDAPMREFLEWVAFRPRTYADTMEAWASHCPRFLVWEDALAADLISLVGDDGRFGTAAIVLTPSGAAALAARD